METAAAHKAQAKLPLQTKRHVKIDGGELVGRNKKCALKAHRCQVTGGVVEIV